MDDKSPLKVKKPRYIQTRQRLADWVRGLGVDDKELSPNHASVTHSSNGLRGSTFEPRIRDAICGHSPRSVADEYEMPSLGDMAEALKKFPRYDI